MTVGALESMLVNYPKEMTVKIVIFHNELSKDRLFTLCDISAIRRLSEKKGGTTVVGITHKKHL